MGQSAEAVVALLFIVLSIAAAVGWTTPEHFVVNGLLTAGALASFSLLVYAMLRKDKDKAPDFLHRLVGNDFFERDGFTFALVPRPQDGVCQMAILFQNRYSEPCEAQVVIQPSRQFFMNRRPIQKLTIGISCEGGAFGVVFVSWGIPKQFQGQKQNIDVGGSVRWPTGKGQMLRFRDGIAVKGPQLTSFQVATTVAAALGGMIVLHTPVRLGIQLPTDVAESVPKDSAISILTLWRPGDPDDIELPL